jgi:Circularly permutated YpsA SLOG family
VAIESEPERTDAGPIPSVELARADGKVRAPRPLLPVTIVSGGQTGADRAGLDWAIEHGLKHGGWCPKGRRAEDGPIPACYALKETPGVTYIQRTEWNVRDSDGTVIFTTANRLSAGPLRTLEFAIRQRKPHVHLHAGLREKAAEALTDWLRQNEVRVLNIAGPRASKDPRIGAFVRSVLDQALGSASQT